MELVYGDLDDVAAYIVAATSLVPVNLPYRGARVRLSADLSPGTSGFSVIPFGIEDRDTDGFWSLAQPTRFVIPAGVKKIKLATYVRSPNGAAGRYVFFKKNGGYFFGGGGIGEPGTSYDMSLQSDVIDVVAGDYFELELFGTTATVGAGLTSNPGLGTWFSLEVCEV
jgi:hypothetical protein